MATVKPNTNEKVAHMRGVKKGVRAELTARAARVRAVVNAHRDTGALKSSMSVRTNKTDSTVEISDPAVYAINYGHRAPDGSWVPGIHAIEAAL